MRFASLTIMSALIALVGCAHTQTSTHSPAPGQPTEGQSRSPEQIAQAGTPGEQHALLSQLEGAWTYSIKLWMEPNKEPQHMEGKSDNSMIFDGRHLLQRFAGEAMGRPFEGQSITSYDNVRGQFSSVYMDNMSTGMMTSTGAYDVATKSIVETGSFSCPVTGEKNISSRSVLTFVDNEHYTYTSYTKGADGSEVKLMEISYTKKSGDCPMKKGHECPHAKKGTCCSKECHGKEKGDSCKAKCEGSCPGAKSKCHGK